ncbi:MAG: polysulfide reductase NrfD [Actinobacteria bacterium]|nr:polysulfide reductase NrfD [Actinomycetota bacterium]
MDQRVRNLKRLFWGVGSVLFVVGLVGWYLRLAHGHLDANYGSIVTWGLWVSAYIYFIGLSAGSFLISSLVYVFNVKRFESIGRLSLFTAVVTLGMALLSIWVDLGHMERFWHVIRYPNFRSPMAWMIWLYGIYFVLLLAELWFVLRRDLVLVAAEGGRRGRLYRILTVGSRDTSEDRAARDAKVVRVLATVGVPIAIMFHGGVGTLFGVVAARPSWNSGLFPILFLLSALVSGGALLIVVSAIFQDGWRRNRDTILALGRLVLGLLLLDLLFQLSEILVTSYGQVPGHIAALKLMTGGPYWWVFWVWQLALGALVPVTLLASRTRTDPRWVSLAGLLIAVGFLGVRLNVVIPAFATEEIEGLASAVASRRMSAHYFPSVSEWLLTAGIVGLGLLLFGLGERLLPNDATTHLMPAVTPRSPKPTP